MSAHYEIERKYLVRYPVLPLPVPAGITPIRQTYLLCPPGTTERVRMRGDRFFYTRKVRVTSVTAQEEERELSREEYETLLERRDPSLNVIEKQRQVFEWKGQVFELDLFPFWKKQAVLEIELASEDTPVELPPFLTLIREVTEEPAYKNRRLAAFVPEE